MEVILEKNISKIEESDLELPVEEFNLKINKLLIKATNNTRILAIQREQIIEDIQQFKKNATNSNINIILRVVNKLLENYNKHAMSCI